jgi:hypothetical protein
MTTAQINVICELARNEELAPNAPCFDIEDDGTILLIPDAGQAIYVIRPDGSVQRENSGREDAEYERMPDECGFGEEGG